MGSVDELDAAVARVIRPPSIALLVASPNCAPRGVRVALPMGASPFASLAPFCAAEGAAAATAQPPHAYELCHTESAIREGAAAECAAGWGLVFFEVVNVLKNNEAPKMGCAIHSPRDSESSGSRRFPSAEQWIPWFSWVLKMHTFGR